MDGNEKVNQELYFSVKDTVQDNPINLDNLSLPIISELTDFVAKFIRGSSSIDLKGVKVAVRSGSLALVVPSTSTTAAAVTDYREVRATGSLDNIDPVRAKIIVDLQKKARNNSNLTYTISTISGTSDASEIINNSVTISRESNYRVAIEDKWVQTETYVYGRVENLGGKTTSNIHLTLQNGTTIKIDADSDLLANDDENRVYKQQLVRIKAEQNLRTKKLRNESLISFEKYQPHFDEQEFQATAAKVRASWADVPDIVAWVEEIRGNYARPS